MYRTIEAYLKNWKDKNITDRLPIILRGARQVGKSFTVEKFGQEHFDSIITVNFELNPDFGLCFESLDPHSICSKLEIICKSRIIPGKTLLFLDEIQNCPKAIMALRYFKEKMPLLHVIAAGSLLEFSLHDEQFSFPVGRVEFLYLRPLSFHEFLISQDHHKLVELLENATINQPLDDFAHQQLLKVLRLYFLIGGMPSVVRNYSNTHSLVECQSTLINILETYRSDFPKYATKTQFKYLQTLFEKAPGLICQHFKYTSISHDHRSADIKVAIEHLGWAGLLYKILSTNASGIPLNVHSKENKFKMLFLDIGLVNSSNHLDFKTVWETELLQINSGIQAEQFVGQEMIAYSSPQMRSQLFYWERDKKGSMAEVDYVVQYGSHIIPVEVKAGTTGSLKSLQQFLSDKKAPLGVRISQHPLSFHDGIFSIPLYLIGQLPRLLAELL